MKNKNIEKRIDIFLKLILIRKIDDNAIIKIKKNDNLSPEK
tara:strand:+ start:636 stop:758 length:123 start_codon:yes stop_codon:yes gene_type:complete